MIKTLLGQVKQYKKSAILTPVFAVLEVLMETLIPYMAASLIDEGIEVGLAYGSMDAIIKYGAIMLGMAFLSLTFAITAGRLAASASTGFAANLRSAMFRKIQTYSFANIDKFSTGGLITRLTTDVTNIQQAFQMSTRMAVRAPVTLIFSLIMCFVINRRISLIFLGAIVFLGMILVFVVKKVSKIFAEVFKKYDELNTGVQENISAIRVVKAYVREPFETEKFQKASGLLYKVSMKAEKIMALIPPGMMLVVYALTILVSWFAARFIVGGEMTTGELTSLFSYIMSVMMSLMMLLGVFAMLVMSLASGKRIVEILQEEPAVKEPENPVIEVKSGDIVFENVSFSYRAGDGGRTLSDIDLQIKSGETIGIIGGTGSGKSSLVNLISRLYDVDKGCVKVGGVDVRGYELSVLRDSVSVVLQKNVLFSGTVLENLRWGREDATEEECRRACLAAAADEFICKMPDGYNSRIEQGGSNVSGGQRQRLCIARALLKSPKILVLDDSTSAVDTATDAKIRRAMREYIPGTTKLIIAQRISSVKDADRIIVIDDGRVNAFDTHENLLKTNEIYREIYETQMSMGGDFDQPAAGREA
ncbi:MAG: ABC transporter ATP-binding protein [Lachnospiraceae bacterium]|nr:ABC transporter ATP-binding protein [Lachnospiraceae bacterium]